MPGKLNYAYTTTNIYHRFLLSQNEIENSISAMNKCIEIEPYHILAREGIENLKGVVVDQWHFRMLNDRRRNEAYESAICRAISKVPDAVVLDIGGGSGLLSIYAARAGARHVYCCEMSVHMAELARRCILMEGYEDRITVMEAHSSQLMVATDCDEESSTEWMLPERVSIVVSELLDSGLLGEHVVEVLNDAKNRLLRPGGIIIPYSAKVHGVCISSPEISARQCLQTKDWSSGWSSVVGHLDSLVVSNCSRKALNSLCPIVVLDEDYSCTDLRTLNHIPITNAFEVAEIEFCASEHRFSTSFTMGVCFGKGWVCLSSDQDGINSADITLPAIAEKCFDSVGFWFELYLENPRSSNVVNSSLSTFPDEGSCGWDQAVAFVHRKRIQNSRPYVCVSNLFQPVTSENSVIDLRCTIHSDKITFSSLQDNHDDNYSSRSDLRPFFIGEGDMAALNNVRLLEIYMETLQVMCQELRRGDVGHWTEGIRIVELCGSWRSHVLSAVMAHCWKRANLAFEGQFEDFLSDKSNVDSFWVLCTTSETSLFFKELMEYQNAVLDLFARSDKDNLRHTQDCRLTEKVAINTGSLVENAANGLREIDSLCDILICDLVDGSGMIRQGILLDIAFALDVLRPSRSDGTTSGEIQIAPVEVDVIISLFECAKLWNENRVDVSNLVGVSVVILCII